MKLPGIYVEIKGDYSDLERKMREAKSMVTSQSTGISNALNNALSPQSVKGSIDRIVGAFGTLNRAASVSSSTFSKIGADLGELRKVTGLTEQQFAKLQSQLLKTQAANAQENALKRIASACGLAEKEVRQLGLQFGMTLAQINKVTGSPSAQIDKIASATQSAESSMISFGSAAKYALGFLSAGALMEFGRSVVETVAQLDSLNRSFVAITGSQKLASDEMNAMRAIADATGQNFYALADDYKRLMASTMGTSIEGAKTRDVFLALSEAAAVLGLSNEQVSLSLKALGQMASKGTVQMEELKNQLGDHLPGAMRDAANGIGKTTAQLYEMAKNGELLAEDVIPGLAREWHKLYQSAANTAALESSQAAINKMSEAWTEFKASMSDNDTVVGSIRMITAALSGLNSVLKSIREQKGGVFSGVEMQAEAAALGVEEAALKRISILKEKIANTQSNISLVSGNKNMLPEVQSGALKQLNEDLMNQRIELEKLDGTLTSTSAKERQFAKDLVNRVKVTEQGAKVTDKMREATAKYLETGYDRAKKEYEAAKAGAAGDSAKLLAVEKKYKEEIAKLDKQAADAAKRAGAEARKQAKEYEDMIDSLVKSRAEQREYEKRVASLGNELRAGRITQDEYNEGIKNAEHVMTSYKERIKDAKEQVKKLAEATKQADQWKIEVNQALMTDAERRIDQLKREHALLKEDADNYAKRYGWEKEWAENAKRGLDEKLLQQIEQINDEASQMGKLFENVAEDIQDAFSDMFLDMLNGTDNAMESIGNMFKKLLAELATMAIARPIIVPIVFSMGSAMGLSQGTIAKSLGMDTSQLNSMGGGSSLFSLGGSGWTGMQVDLATALDNRLGLTDLAEAISGMNSSVFGAATAGLGSLAMSLLSGQGLTAQTGLQAGGAAVGSLFGPAGSVIGGILGSLAGGLFDNGPDTFQFTPASTAYGRDYIAGKGIGINSYNFTGGDTDSKIYAVYADQIRSIQNAFNEQIGAFAKELPVEIAQTMQNGLAAVDLSQTLIDASKGEFEAQNAEDAIQQVATKYSAALTQALGNSYADAVDAFIAKNGVAGLLGNDAAWNMLTSGAQSNVTSSIANSIAAIRGGNAAGGTADIQAVMQAIGQIGSAMSPITEIIETNGLTEYELAIRSINKQFEQYRDALVAAGVDMSKYTDFYRAWNMQLADAAEQFGDAAETVADRLAAATDALKASFSAEQSSISAFHNDTLAALNTQLKQAQEEVSNLTALSNMLQSTMRSLKIDGLAFEKQQRIVAQGILQQALGGNVDQSKLSDALQTLSQGNTGLFSTFEDYARDYLKTAISIDKLNENTKSQLSSAEEMVAYIEEQIELENKWYEDEIKRLDDQLNALLGINTSVLSLADAIANFQAAQAAANSGGSGGSGSDSGAYDYYAAKADQLNSTAYQGKIDWVVSDVVEAFSVAGWTALDHWINAGQYEGLQKPSFAVGTDYVPYDMTANIHKGERIVPAAYNRSDATNKEIVAELKQLRAQVAAMVSHSRKSAETLDRWEYDGMPETRTA